MMKYSKYPSIKEIRSFAQIQEVTLEQMHSEIEGLNPKKATTFGMNLWKAFDCIKHDLLIAKLDAYVFSHEALCIIDSY